MNPGDAPRRGLLWALAVAVLATAVAVPVLVDSDEAAADELARFGSCAELAAWRPADAYLGDAVDGLSGGAIGVERAAAEGEDAAAPAAADSGTGTGTRTGDTNVAVEGVDELDVVDRVDDRRALVAAEGALALVDLVDGVALATVPTPFDARITYDPDAGVVWVAGTNSAGGTDVARVAVGAVDLSVDGTWSISGWLVDARRTGDRLHVVAVDGAYGAGDGVIPFEGGPVPCEDVLHPVAPSGPEATLVVSLPVTGDMAPVSAAEVVGSGQFVHVTDEAVFLATPVWDGAASATSIHRFDLDTLTHTGSGRVEGQLINQFSMSEQDGYLRVGVTQPGMRILVDDGAIDPVAGAPEEELLNEIVVLDTDGDLDVVGRTPRFGHPGETLHGIRFDGDIAYAVTFLQTDPFYVVDVADPAAPLVVGEVELPGFSAYLHPIGEGLVAGFGPGEDGRATVKLFDVTDPARPVVADDEVLGDDTPVTYDHHAYLGLGDGRFAVPASTWREIEPVGCSEAVRSRLMDEVRALEAELHGTPAPLPERAEALTRRLDTIWTDPCVSPQVAVNTTVVIAGTAGGTIEVEQRHTVTAEQPGSRILALEGGWAVLAGAHLVGIDADGSLLYDVSVA